MDSQDGGLVLMMKSIMIMTIHHQVHTRHIAVHRIIQAAAQEAAVIHQRAILQENIIVVVHQKAVQILRAAVRTAIASYTYSGSSSSSSSGSKKYYHDSYDDGYDDVYMDGDYDYDRYDSDDDYAAGVDDAIDDDDEDW